MLAFSSIRVRIIAAHLAGLLAIGARGAGAQGFVPRDSVALGRSVDSIFSSLDRRDAPGCAVAAMRAGRVLYSNGYGMADLEHGVPIRSGTRFYVASISKQFTATSILLLARRGSLSLDDDVRRWVPEVPDFGETITIRQLLGHTSGLRNFADFMELTGWPGGENGDWLMTPSQFLSLVARQRALNFRPGTEFLYSNNGYWLLAIIVQRASGRSLREFAAAEIFRPLGMSSTTFRDDHGALIPDRAVGYVAQDSGRYVMRGPAFDLVGAGGLFTTVGDLARWDGNFYSAIVGDDSLVALLQRPGRSSSGDTLPYAMGLRRLSYRGLPTIEHGGVWAGYNAQFIRFPAQGFSVAVLCNGDGAMPKVLASRVADRFLARELSMATAGALEPSDVSGASPRADPSALRDLPGLYWSAVTGTVERVTRHADTLEIVYGESGPAHALVSLGRGRYATIDAARHARFVFGKDRFGRRWFDQGPSGYATIRYVPADTTPPTPRRAAQYVGMYASAEFDQGVIVISSDAGSLTFHSPAGVAIPLRPVGTDAFVGEYYGVRFARGESGGVRALLLNTEQTRELRFDRRTTPPAKSVPSHRP